MDRKKKKKTKVSDRKANRLKIIIRLLLIFIKGEVRGDFMQHGSM